MIIANFHKCCFMGHPLSLMSVEEYDLLSNMLTPRKAHENKGSDPISSTHFCLVRTASAISRALAWISGSEIC